MAYYDSDRNYTPDDILAAHVIYLKVRKNLHRQASSKRATKARQAMYQNLLITLAHEMARQETSFRKGEKQ